MTRLRKLWDEHVHSSLPSGGSDPRVQAVALYSSWLGSIVESAVTRGELEVKHVQMLKVRREEGNQALFLASGELGEPVRSYVARLLAMEEILSSLPVRK
ncbi:MAG TPA: hypothetical protein VNP53_07225 [Methylomirabilota bacterium]|nr:hypothetical protein [Methylomirabilota bacterium]